MRSGAIQATHPASSTKFEGARGTEVNFMEKLILWKRWPLKEAECKDVAGNTMTFCAKCATNENLTLAEGSSGSPACPGHAGEGRSDFLYHRHRL